MGKQLEAVEMNGDENVFIGVKSGRMAGWVYQPANTDLWQADVYYPNELECGGLLSAMMGEFMTRQEAVDAAMTRWYAIDLAFTGEFDKHVVL